MDQSTAIRQLGHLERLLRYYDKKFFDEAIDKKAYADCVHYARAQLEKLEQMPQANISVVNNGTGHAIGVINGPLEINID